MITAPAFNRTAVRCPEAILALTWGAPGHSTGHQPAACFGLGLKHADPSVFPQTSTAPCPIPGPLTVLSLLLQFPATSN